MNISVGKSPPIYFLLLATTYLAVFPFSTVAEQKQDIHATLRLNVQLTSQPPTTSLWQRSLRYLDIRKDVPQHPEPGTGVTVHSTGYAPSPYQTDATPCITAAGTRVRPGVVAANWLPFGTLVQIGNEVFIVEDRMNPRYPHSVDIFFPSTNEALAFGRQDIDVVILSYGEPGQMLPRELPEEVSAEQIESTANQASPTFKAKSIGRLSYWQKVFSDFIGIKSYDVNRYDVDCFSD